MNSAGLSWWGRAYVAGVVAVGGILLTHSLYTLYAQDVSTNWYVLAGLTVVSGWATVRLPSVPATISISEAFVFTSSLLYGPAAGTITVALDALAISYTLARKGHPAYRLLFNIFALPISLWAGAHLFFWWSGLPALSSIPDKRENIELTRYVVALILFAGCYFFLNSWSIAGAISVERRLSPLKVWKDNFAWLWLNYFVGASVASLLIFYSSDLSYGFLAIVLPLLALLYYTFKTAMGRAEDTNRHLKQLNRLYMSTIETLAMAIDAKDQITHGHIRRVQHYAVELAKRVGITETAQISAIEAASLLHDMGKLAVPEYILNKPGSLTPAEFEKMKLHASVGADILGAIEFPYPVVPIVRHHHENWDGTGYPDGLVGTDIPIGARILSVVDCFDALTSDRPYRPKLPDNEAIRILLQRRGTMYDPVVVDTFIAVHQEIAPPIDDSEDQKDGLSAITRGHTKITSPKIRLDEINASTEETVVLYELSRSLSSAHDFSTSVDLVAQHVRRVLPASTLVFFVYDEVSDELVARHASGEHTGLFSGLRIPRGQRLTGWVGANRLPVLNSDPVLDLGEVARSARPPLRSCISTPITAAKDLVGVLNAYSAQRDVFSENHQRILEAIATQVGHTMKAALHSDIEHASRNAVAFPGIDELKVRFGAEAESFERTSGPSVVYMNLILARAAVREDVLKIVGEAAISLGGPDATIYQVSESCLILFLPDADVTSTRSIAKAIKEQVQSIVDVNPAVLAIEVGLASAPTDGKGLVSLLDVAKSSSGRIDPPSAIH